jgi:hypothetical protein
MNRQLTGYQGNRLGACKLTDYGGIPQIVGALVDRDPAL